METENDLVTAMWLEFQVLNKMHAMYVRGVGIVGVGEGVFKVKRTKEKFGI